uniref:Uncharacterized protein n=1 Tax=Siphoviridae sp. ctqSm5 TaxID=2827949 RepID=A0A8S5SQD6_9CAUD|nr:MAG TPA: hypothetical protein [Siphoviridae sp. ctqSm5]
MGAFIFPTTNVGGGGGTGGGGQPLDPRTIISAVLTGDTLEFTHLNNAVTRIPLDYVSEW